MKKITINGVTGDWNERTYSSNKADYRIYVDNQELHVTKQELDEATKADEVDKKKADMINTMQVLVRLATDKMHMIDIMRCVKDYVEKSGTNVDYKFFTDKLHKLSRQLFEDTAILELALKSVTKI